MFNNREKTEFLLSVLLLALVLPERTSCFPATIRAVGESAPTHPAQPVSISRLNLHLSLSLSDADAEKARQRKKDDLQMLLSSVTSNVSTPKELTAKILSAVRNLEELCPTRDDDVLEELGGNWELTWTAQDKSSPEGSQSPLLTWINPLENQSYSNNPNGPLPSAGRSNPILPQDIQNTLENLGILKQPDENEGPGSPVRSSQAIDLKKKRVRNVVAFEVRNPFRVPLPLIPDKSTRGSLTVDVRFSPNAIDARRVDVKFEACRLSVRDSPLDINFPLGVVGPTGWLRTGYIDDDLRITRGHKGSVFILSRTARKRRSTNA